MVYCIDGDTRQERCGKCPPSRNSTRRTRSSYELPNDPEGNPEFGVLEPDRPTARTKASAWAASGRCRLPTWRYWGTRGSSWSIRCAAARCGQEPTFRQFPRLRRRSISVPGRGGNENGALGGGRTLRASDGEVLKVPRLQRRSIRRASASWVDRSCRPSRRRQRLHAAATTTFFAGKDVWSKAFPAGSHGPAHGGPTITGVIDPDGEPHGARCRGPARSCMTGQSLPCKAASTLADLKALQRSVPARRTASAITSP